MDEFIDALESVIEAKTARDKAFNDCDLSWGYSGYYEEETLKSAKERFRTSLQNVFRELLKELESEPK